MAKKKEETNIENKVEIKKESKNQTNLEIIGLSVQQARRKFHNTDYSIDIVLIDGVDQNITVSNGSKSIRVVVVGGKIVSAIV